MTNQEKKIDSPFSGGPFNPISLISDGISNQHTDEIYNCLEVDNSPFAWPGFTAEVLIGARLQNLVPENERIVERDVVRVLTFQMKTRDEFMENLLPNQPILDRLTKYKQELMLTNQPYSVQESLEAELHALTSDFSAGVQIFIEKDNTANNPGDLMPPGGTMELHIGRDRRKTTAEKASAYQLASELHLWGINSSNVDVVTKRDVKFPHQNGKIYKNHESITACQILPTLTSASFQHPEDKIAGVHRIPTIKVARLFDEGRLLVDGHNLNLIDSMQKSPDSRQKRKVILDEYSHDQVFTQLKGEAARFEAHLRLEIIQELIKLGYVKDQNLLRIWEKRFSRREKFSPGENIESFMEFSQNFLIACEQSVSSKARIPQLIIGDEMYQKLKDLGVSDLYQRRRAYFLEGMRRSFDIVRLRRTIELSKHMGPQQPYIVAQLIPELSHLGINEFNEISKVPELEHIITAVCDAFEIDPSIDDEWGEKISVGIENYVFDREKQLIRHSSSNIDQSALRSVRIAVAERFAKPINFRVPEIDIHTETFGIMTQLREFQKFVKSSLTKIANKQLQDKTITDEWYIETNDIMDILVNAFGYDPYKKGKTVDHKVQSAAWRWLLHILDLQKIKLFRDKVFTEMKDEAGIVTEGVFQYPFYSIFMPVNSNDPEQKFVLIDESTNKPRGFQINFEGKDYDLTDITTHIWSHVRYKSDVSLLRKWLERGKFDHNGIMDTSDFMTDLIGRMITLDTEDFQEQLKIKFKKLHLAQNTIEGITLEWQRNVFSHILSTYNTKLTDENIWTVQMAKPVYSKNFEGIIGGGLYVNGSGASNIHWDQLKVVVSAQNVGTHKSQSTELYLFPDRTSKEAKIQDDIDFWAMRLLSPSSTGLLPLLMLIMSDEHAYEIILKAKHELERKRAGN